MVYAFVTPYTGHLGRATGRYRKFGEPVQGLSASGDPAPDYVGAERMHQGRLR